MFFSHIILLVSHLFLAILTTSANSEQTNTTQNGTLIMSNSSRVDKVNNTLILNATPATATMLTTTTQKPMDCNEISRTYSDMELVKFLFPEPTEFFKPRPVKENGMRTHLSVWYFFRGIVDIDFRAGILIMNGLIYVGWRDHFRIWKNIHPYNCTDYLVFTDPSRPGLWTPDIVLGNALGDEIFIIKPQDAVKVEKSGWSSIDSPGTTRIRCKFDVTYFPFDRQTCYMYMELKKSTAKTIAVWKCKFAYSSFYFPNEQWKLVSAEGENKQAYNFEYCQVKFVIQRKPQYYLLTLLIPTVAIAITALSSFLLPINDPLRIEISITSMLAFTVFLSFVGGELPASSDNIPLLLVALGISVGLIVMVTIIQAICIYLCDKASGNSNTTKIGLKIARKIGWIWRIHYNPEKHENESNYNRTYIAKVIDRTAFFMFLILFPFTLLVAIVILPAVNGMF